jgi:hypothetical protein
VSGQPVEQRCRLVHRQRAPHRYLLRGLGIERMRLNELAAEPSMAAFTFAKISVLSSRIITRRSPSISCTSQNMRPPSFIDPAARRDQNVVP